MLLNDLVLQNRLKGVKAVTLGCCGLPSTLIYSGVIQNQSKQMFLSDICKYRLWIQENREPLWKPGKKKLKNKPKITPSPQVLFT